MLFIFPIRVHGLSLLFLLFDWKLGNLLASISYFWTTCWAIAQFKMLSFRVHIDVSFDAGVDVSNFQETSYL